uniref:Uncharacterized protein n=1 Tax=Meloidogyne hapla TaxID=6305 RepID=A0A1I8BD11_MELHA
MNIKYFLLIFSLFLPISEILTLKNGRQKELNYIISWINNNYLNDDFLWKLDKELYICGKQYNKNNDNQINNQIIHLQFEFTIVQTKCSKQINECLFDIIKDNSDIEILNWECFSLNNTNNENEIINNEKDENIIICSNANELTNTLIDSVGHLLEKFDKQGWTKFRRFVRK